MTDSANGYEPLQISTDLATKPAIPTPTGTPPAQLITDDVVVGEGTAAAQGKHVTVKYVGVSYSNGKQFDSSWDRGSTFDFPLGAGRVITPVLGYGERGMGPIAANETLVFVVDLVKVG